jgi:hypothetical protein
MNVAQMPVLTVDNHHVACCGYPCQFGDGIASQLFLGFACILNGLRLHFECLMLWRSWHHPDACTDRRQRITRCVSRAGSAPRCVDNPAVLGAVFAL